MASEAFKLIPGPASSHTFTTSRAPTFLATIPNLEPITPPTFKKAPLLVDLATNCSDPFLDIYAFANAPILPMDYHRQGGLLSNTTSRVPANAGYPPFHAVQHSSVLAGEGLDRRGLSPDGVSHRYHGEIPLTWSPPFLRGGDQQCCYCCTKNSSWAAGKGHCPGQNCQCSKQPQRGKPLLNFPLPRGCGEKSRGLLQDRSPSYHRVWSPSCPTAIPAH